MYDIEESNDYSNPLDPLYQALFCEANGVEVCKKIVKEYYDSYVGNIKRKVPTLTEVLDHIQCHNDELIFEIALEELPNMCESCLRICDCWENGVPFSEAKEDGDYYGCEADAMADAYDTISYELDLINLEELLLKIVAALNYSMIITPFYYYLIYEDPPLTYSKTEQMRFNDAQIKMFPGWNGYWSTNKEFEDKLMLTGG